MKYTIHEFNKKFPNDDACLDFMFHQRTTKQTHCLKCGTEFKYYRVRNRKCYECKDCGNQIHPLAHTIFHKSDTPLRSWFFAMFLFSNSKNGVSAKELERHLGVTYKCAWRIAKQIRMLMGQGGNLLSGIVEADETYIGGRHKMKKGRSKKQIVFGAVERQGRVSAHQVKSSGARVLLPIIDEVVDPKATLHTDELGSYKSLKQRGYSHTTVTHSALEYVRGSVHTNTIEGFWSQLKRSLDGTHHAVSPRHLQSYVDQFVFYYNHRSVAVYPVLLERVGLPLRQAPQTSL